MKRNTEQRNTDAAQSIQRYQVEISEYKRVHFSYEYEEALLSAVSKGDQARAYFIIRDMLGLPEGGRKDILALLENTVYTSAGIMSRSSQKQAEYAVVLTVSLFARAAIRAGVDPYHAYNLNDLYLQKISETQNTPTYWSILLDALDTYLNEVKKLLATQTRSIHVLHAKQYIGQNLNKTLSLNEIAAEIGLSPNYLSALFTKAEGVGIKEYIILQRIEAAKNLLMYSDKDIGMIATYIGFCSQSHFGKLFRERTGMTPHVFRSLNQKSL